MQILETSLLEPVPDGSPQLRGRSTILAAERIRDMIVEGELPPGSRIPERIICERLGLSRTPLREAFKILEVEGLVSIQPNRGAIVVRLSLPELDAAYEVLIGLEGIAAEFACARATEAEIAEIAALHEEMVTRFRAHDLHHYFRLNHAIHQGIVDAAQNPVLSRIYNAECMRIRRYRFLSNREPARWERAVIEHEQILDALRQRQGGLLREVLRMHQINGWNHTKAILAAEFAPSRPAKRRKRA